MKNQTDKPLLDRVAEKYGVDWQDVNIRGINIVDNMMYIQCEQESEPEMNIVINFVE